MSLFRNPVRTARLGALLLVPVGLMVGCTDLKETPTSLITKDTFYKNSNEVFAGLASVYANLRNNMEDYYALNSVSSAEGVVPVRGGDWFDNGAWLELHRQGWTPNSVVGLREGSGIWNQQYTGVARANILLEALDAVDVAGEAAIRAEVRALRALYYMQLMDVYGGVPIATDTKVEERAPKTRAEVFTFVETELKAARADLPKTWPDQQGRLTRGAADAMLASLYLNARVWGGTPTASGITLGTAKWTEASAFADSVINNGSYSLATASYTNSCGSGFKANFCYDNQTSPENVFVVRGKAVDGLGFNRQYNALHYNSFAGGGGWNGWAIVEQTYNMFEADDPRRTTILAGPQVDLFTGAPVNNRQGSRLIFTATIADVLAANEGEGVRLYKFPLDPGRAGNASGNDFTLYRLAEMYLIKAEAQNELNNVEAARTALNVVRARAFPGDNAKLIPSGLTQAQMRAAIFAERVFELTGEGKRRQDQIREGTYTSGTWFAHDPTPAHKVVMPIPQAQLNTNSKLVQNPGY
ncbi:MAG: RagB/SusD family nutrient uptake outer membrane protein [Gemmatimonadaceae bacterium]|nr:RagB/SusD family nutrient uptake outer membrane protein [Gemmatimonadaceae bacterium]